MLDYDLIKNILITSIGAGIITTALIQKVKGFMASSRYVPIISFIVSMVIGTLFSLSFSNITIINALWSGLFAFIGADVLYQTFEEKIFTPFEQMKEVIEIDREDDDESN